ncbi:MAG: hypothetical protein MR492_01590 [Clostridiales bacterium]|nr:hypothetical protein [Clostridiales bacterium]
MQWLNDSACSYSTELKGVMDMANFMAEEGYGEMWKMLNEALWEEDK